MLVKDSRLDRHALRRHTGGHRGGRDGLSDLTAGYFTIASQAFARTFQILMTFGLRGRCHRHPLPLMPDTWRFMQFETNTTSSSSACSGSPSSSATTLKGPGRPITSGHSGQQVAAPEDRTVRQRIIATMLSAFSPPSPALSIPNTSYIDPKASPTTPRWIVMVAVGGAAHLGQCWELPS